MFQLEFYNDKYDDRKVIWFDVSINSITFMYLYVSMSGLINKLVGQGYVDIYTCLPLHTCTLVYVCVYVCCVCGCELVSHCQ